jgi:hypothetical protein
VKIFRTEQDSPRNILIVVIIVLLISLSLFYRPKSSENRAIRTTGTIVYKLEPYNGNYFCIVNYCGGNYQLKMSYRQYRWIEPGNKVKILIINNNPVAILGDNIEP